MTTAFNVAVINGEASQVYPGTPVTIVSALTVKRSSSANAGLTGAGGIVWSGNGPTLGMLMRAGGALELPTATWDLVTGDVGGLIPGVLYYLGTTPGTLATAPPTQGGSFVTVIGRALSPTALLIEIGVPVLL